MTQIPKCLASVSGLLQRGRGVSLWKESVRGNRSKMKILPEFTYRGIYKTDGEKVAKGDLLVCQTRLNYHPGLNVKMSRHGNQYHEIQLKAVCPGTVFITREKSEPDWDLDVMESTYGHRKETPLFKMTFNVVPHKDEQRFRLVDLV